MVPVVHVRGRFRLVGKEEPWARQTVARSSSGRSGRGEDQRFLWASVDENGDLHIDGQDLGPATSLVSADGEYEWFQTIPAQHVPAVVELLGGQPGDDVLDVLEGGYTGLQSYDLAGLLRDSDVPVKRFVYWIGAAVTSAG